MINNSWDELLREEYSKKYFKQILNFLDSEYSCKNIYPPKNKIFRAFELTKPEEVKVVILGQDPYHEDGEAEGLAFSVPNGIKMPPSLKNIYKELYNDLNIRRENSSLEDWANKGVLLLNSILTVEKGKPLSHSKIGWEVFTNRVIEILDNKYSNIVFVLWGNNARAKKNLIKNNFVIESAHPSPLSASRGFLGSRPFSKINKLLKENNKEEIRW